VGLGEALCVMAARHANTPAGSRREFSMQRAVFFSNTASRARASVKSPRSPQPASRPSTPDSPANRHCSLGNLASIEQRLDTLAAVILTRLLTPETIGLIRVAVAEARRFPDLATSVSCMGRQRPTEAVARVFGELAASDAIGASPAFAQEKLPETARRFLDLVVLPMLVRALFGEDLTALRAEIEPHAARSVDFFLAACGHDAE
jgi:hypothetical protein